MQRVLIRNHPPWLDQDTASQCRTWSEHFHPKLVEPFGCGNGWPGGHCLKQCLIKQASTSKHACLEFNSVSFCQYPQLFVLSDAPYTPYWRSSNTRSWAPEHQQTVPVRSGFPRARTGTRESRPCRRHDSGPEERHRCLCPCQWFAFLSRPVCTQSRGPLCHQWGWSLVLGQQDLEAAINWIDSINATLCVLLQ